MRVSVIRPCDLCSLRVNLRFKDRVDRPINFHVGIVVVIPAAAPKLIIGVYYILPGRPFGMPIAEHDIRLAVVAIGWPFHRVLWVYVGVETTIRFAVPKHNHVHRTLND